MKRPSLALAIIVKDEIKNLPSLFESVKECVDKIYVTDTGSTDGTLEWLNEQDPAYVNISHFEWCDDFSAARNFNFSQVKEEYIFWMDGDDVLQNKENFIAWRDNAMALSDYWLATYHYATDLNGNPVCSFARERVIKNHKGFKWNYFVHEGIPPGTVPEAKLNAVNTWNVLHKRTVQDIEGDKGRNLELIRKNEANLDSRMKYYYGKEYFDNKDMVNAIRWLMEAISDTSLEMHDRILGCQYAAYAYFHCNQLDQAVAVAHQGLQLDPNRAEFWVVIGDCYLKMQKFANAIPAFNAAKSCQLIKQGEGRQVGVIFSHENCYTFYPRDQLARLFINMGRLEEALREAEESSRYGQEESIQILEQIKKIHKVNTESVGPTATNASRKECDDIVISAPPGTQMYEWDYEIAKKKGIGGSETAAVQMGYWLKKLTGRPVKIFNGRKNDIISEGVEYITNEKLAEYFVHNSPKLHISWRHTIPVTNAKTVIWSHDLLTPGVENQDNYSEVIALSPFHKNYMQAMQGVSPDKVWVSRNGIDPTRFEDANSVCKVPGKVMFPSSPDRGLLEAMQIMDKVENPDKSLHVFYGFDNMMKGPPQMQELAKMLKAEIDKRDYVKFHGNVQQNELASHFMESEVWLYPADFIETYCITALEAIASRCYPVATNIGALQNTVGQFADMGSADLLDERAKEGHIDLYAQKVDDALWNQKWEKIDVPLTNYSWESVAKEWIDHFGL